MLPPESRGVEAASRPDANHFPLRQLPTAEAANVSVNSTLPTSTPVWRARSTADYALGGGAQFADEPIAEREHEERTQEIEEEVEQGVGLAVGDEQRLETQPVGDGVDRVL